MLERGELWLLFFDLLFSLNRSMKLYLFVATLAQGTTHLVTLNQIAQLHSQSSLQVTVSSPRGLQS